MEDPENIKSSQLKNFVFQIWALSVHEYENVLGTCNQSNLLICSRSKFRNPKINYAKP